MALYSCYDADDKLQYVYIKMRMRETLKISFVPRLGTDYWLYIDIGNHDPPICIQSILLHIVALWIVRLVLSLTLAQINGCISH